MRYWIRELAGWLLVGFGLYVFLICITDLIDPNLSAPRLLQAGPLTVIGFIIFRGGIHLLKVALAARVCMQAQVELSRQARRGEPGAARASDAPWDW